MNGWAGNDEQSKFEKGGSGGKIGTGLDGGKGSLQ